MTNNNDDLTDNVFIGRNAGYKMEHGSYNIFLGHGAGEDLIESNNLFILKSGDIEYRFQIEKEESEKFRIFIQKVVNESLNKEISSDQRAKRVESCATERS